ncbi:NACHT domain-containing protein [Halothiobacillus sp.]|uniref:NACHT domain-containing protein n=1 Tax=Halothiobacillus sp. TaxID=1891311 RepID=UPI002AD3BFBE|nr:NACHT domain-containing protein [Halothiobacillus sp.]
MITEAVAAEGFKIALNAIFQQLKKTSSLYAKLKSIDVDNSYLKASKVEEVKTIWQVDKVVNLNDFYYPSKINIDSKRVEINTLEDLPGNGKLIIQGTAGQGKSIFLRYLAGTELKSGTKIPIFIELRKITNKINIQDLILSSLDNLGIDCDEKILGNILQSGKCTLLLDAFDEVNESQVQDTISYLDNLCSKYHSLQIIISSRPGSHIQRATFFRVFDLCPLIPSDFPAMLEKFFHDDKNTNVDDIVKAIHENGAGIAYLITTPLLLTLLTITYKSYHRIPERLHEFYDNLFYLLVNRHDSTKPGFSREFKSGLNEVQLEDLFRAFCFYCMIERKDTLTHTEAVSITKKAKLITQHNEASESGFLDDTKNNTCLIIEEGFEYHFIHKSIKEYHAASFISKSPLQLKEKFYILAVNAQGQQFDQEIKYLKNIDSYYCDKLFLTKMYNKLFKAARFDEKSIDSDPFLVDINVGIFNGKALQISWLESNRAMNETVYFNTSQIIFDAMRDSPLKEKYALGDFSLNLLDAFEDEFLNIFSNRMEKFVKSKHEEFSAIEKRILQQESAINNIHF